MKLSCLEAVLTEYAPLLHEKLNKTPLHNSGMYM